MKETLSIVGLIILIIALIGVGPILTIASINTLFNMSIAYNIWTWLSVVWLCLLAFGSSKKST